MTVKFSRLKNSFGVATEYIPGVESAAIGVWINLGGRHERKGENGLAHFLEHMAFKGTQKRNAQQIAEAIESVGGYMNAYTSKEITNYYVRILPNDIPLALDVLSDIIINSVYSAKDINLERNVILQEIAQTNDTPDEIIFDWLQEVSYPDQSVGRPILGSSKLIEGYGQKDIIEFTCRHYTPDRMILCASGKVDHEKILHLAEKKFGRLIKKKRPEKDDCIFVGGTFQKRKELEQAHLAFGMEAPSAMDSDIYVSQIFSIILGGGMSSRLFQEVREKRGLCYSIFSTIDSISDSGMFTIYAATSEDKILQLSDVIVDELKRCAEKVTSEELNRARAQIKAGMLMGLESTINRAERLARTITLWNRVVPISETVEKIDNVSLNQLKDFGKNLCNKKESSLVFYGPMPSCLDLANITKNLAN